MPHIKRIVEPVLVSRRPIDPNVRDELECMTNNTLANVIRELSSLSRHAEDMFRELAQEATSVFRRGNQLQRRIEDVREKVQQLNPNVDVLDLKDIHLQKPFKSSVHKEQQVLSKSTVPRSIIEMYEKCDAPPALDKLDQFREDGKSSMKFYTDPSYFAELWAIEMGKQIQENKKLHEQKKKGRERHQTKRPQHVKEAKATTKEKHQKLQQGAEFVDYLDPAAIKHKIEKSQEEANRMREQQEQALAQEQLRYQQQMQQEEARRQSQRQQQQQQQIHYQQQNSYPQHDHQERQMVPSYEPSQTGQFTHIPDGYPVDTDVRIGYGGHPQPPPQFSEKRISPDKMVNGNIGNRRAIASPNRPLAPPPAPPPVTGSRDSLPPPPSPPPDSHLERGPVSMSPQAGRVVKAGSLRDSPVRQGLRPDAELPPPPPSPPFHQGAVGTLDGIGYVAPLPPPPSPPPLDNTHQVPPPPPPPPLPPPMLMQPVVEMNGDSVSLSSSSTGALEPSRPNVGADRSALMKEIIQVDINKRLRKVEAREHKKQVPSAPGMLDVQAIMDKAIEMRRKVIEISDSDGEESEDDGWDSES